MNISGVDFTRFLYRLNWANMTGNKIKWITLADRALWKS